MTTNWILQEIRRLTQDVLRGYDVDIYLFGSWAHGRPSHASDVDVGVDAHTPLPPGTLAILRERLEESHIPYRVEVVDLTSVDDAFRATVVHQGVRWNG